jgi:malonyl-CoA/methylmalonyl-CoA synthetase
MTIPDVLSITADEAEEAAAQAAALPPPPSHNDCHIIYTSGTTARPKGCVSSFAAVAHQARILVDAWQWSSSDVILHCLPLHHVHGLVNALICPLMSGACIKMLPKFDAHEVWNHFSGERGLVPSVFMGVPTMYVRLIATHAQQPQQRQQELSAAVRRMRLLVSGSAAMPTSVHNAWRALSGGSTLLERYGMTVLCSSRSFARMQAVTPALAQEFGMALSNPYTGTRVPGFVGQPLPGIAVKLVREDGSEIPDGSSESGELLVSGRECAVVSASQAGL